jgi:hypothetical protein
MKNYFELGPAPCDEDCIQVTDKQDYVVDMIQECERYKEMLMKRFSGCPKGAHLSVKHFPHDLGPYYEVIINFDNSNPIAKAYAFHVDRNCPAKWDDKSILPFVYEGDKK